MNALNQEQQSVAEAIKNIQAGGRLVVSGRAGSGKTYAIANSVAGRKVLFLAPTHPARAVLEQELRDRQHTAMTIHKAIGWRKTRNDDLEAAYGYRPAKEARKFLERASKPQPGSFLDVDLLVVDECSMVGSSLFGPIEEYAKEFNLPVVYSGDRFQLPPVGDKEAIWHQGFEIIDMEGSVRFPKNSEIYRLGEALRGDIQTG